MTTVDSLVKPGSNLWLHQGCQANCFSPERYADMQELDRNNQDGAAEPELAEQVPSIPIYSVFSKAQKRSIISMVAIAGFFSPLSANIYFPALNPLGQDLHVSSSLINLSLTSYMIFQGLAPTVFGDLADMVGRRPVYLIGFIVYIGANVGLALQTDFVALVLLRCLQSTGSSGTVALGNGVVADIASSGERGTYMGKLRTALGLEASTNTRRHSTARSHGCRCYCTYSWWAFCAFSWLEVVVLVFDHPFCHFSCPIPSPVPRDWKKHCWKWIIAEPEVEHSIPTFFS